ncbi:hypothetical protein ACS0TY_000560 [Phlomoides rotata]
MTLGSKADLFHLEGQSWLCTNGLPSDVCIEVGEMCFHLHKFPLMTKSQLLEKLIQECCQKDEEANKCVVSLPDLPGGAESFFHIARFCYGGRIDLTATNVVGIRCTAEYLQMTGEGNLVSQTVTFLDQVLTNWMDTIKALETCEAALPLSEELHIISRCIDFLASKVCTDSALARWSTSRHGGTAHAPLGTSPWNGIHSSSEQLSPMEEWWYDDVANFKLPLFKRLIMAVGSKGMTPDGIARAVMFYARRYLPLIGRNLVFPIVPTLSDAEQRTLIEEIVEILPNQKGATPTKFLLKLLRTSMVLHASSSCRETLERRIGAQLEDAVLRDLLIPNTSDSMETLYDVECVQRIVDHFLSMDHDDVDSNIVEEDEVVEMEGGSTSLSSTTMVANLLDEYLAEVAPDPNLTLEKFLLLGSAIPDYARSLDDGIYRAVDIYLKEHPYLTESEREQVCRLMNCQKLSIEASTHAAQNERLPLRVIVQVLFFEQLRLRTYVAGWYFFSDNLEQSQDLSGNMGRKNEPPFKSKEGEAIKLGEMKERVCELEKECDDMKQEIDKLVKTKRNWIINFYRKCNLKVKTRSFDIKSPKFSCNGEEHHQPSRRVSLDKKHVHAD